MNSQPILQISKSKPLGLKGVGINMRNILKERYQKSDEINPNHHQSDEAVPDHQF